MESGIADLNWQLILRIQKGILQKSYRLTAYLEKPSRSDLGSTFAEKGVNGCIHMLHSSNSAVVILRYEFSLRQGDDGKSQKRSSHQPQVLLTISRLQI